MLSLLEQMSENLKSAMKGGRKDEVSTLRMILSEAKNKRIEKRVEQISDADVVDVLSSMKKKRIEAAELYDKGNRKDLSDKERAEILVIEQYLPKQMDQAELEKLIAAAVAQTGAQGPKDMGKVMAALMKDVKGKADGGLVSALVKKKLGA